MHNINISNWKEFNILELFDIVSVKGDLKAQQQVEGEIPLVSSGMFNNGICMYIDTPKEKSELIEKNKITVDMFGTAFFQEKDFYAVAHGRVNVLSPKFNISRNIGLFLATIIEKNFFIKYGFSDMCSQANLKKETIMLPQDKNGEPDWDYIENFMEYIKPISQKRITNLQKCDMQYTNVDASEWKDHRIIDLFDIRNTHSILKNSIEEDSGLVPYITASGENNGVSTYVDYDDTQIDEGNCIFIGGKTLTINYQPVDFYSNDSHNLALYLKDKNYRTVNVQLYLISALRASLSWKYSWGDSISKTAIQVDTIKLPTKSDGKPDYEYMNKYIRSLEDKVQLKINKLINI